MASAWDSYLSDADRKVYAETGYGTAMQPPRRPALLVIDVTHDFCGPKGLGRVEAARAVRTACGPQAWAAVPHIATLLAAARAAGAPVLFTNRDAARLKARRGKTARAGEDRAAGNDIVDEIAPASGERVMGKPRPSAFWGTDLADWLAGQGCDGVILTGCTTSGCVRATAVDAFNRDLPALIVPEAVFDRFDASHALALFDCQAKYADLVRAEAAAQLLRGGWAGAYQESNPLGSNSTPR